MFTNKWVRLIVGAAGFCLILYSTRGMYLQITANPDSLYTYVFTFSVSAVVIAAMLVPKSRAYIQANEKFVRRIGYMLIVLSALLMGLLVIWALMDEASVPLSPNWAVGIFVVPFFIGWMIAFLPRMIRQADEMRKLFEPPQKP